MYPKKIVDPNVKREREKEHRKEQLKNLIVNKFRTKYALGLPNADERNQIISDEVNQFIESQKCTEKNLIDLDKKLMAKFGTNQIAKNGATKHSRKASEPSRASSNVGSQQSKRSAMMRAGLNISSQERPMNSSYSKDRNYLSGSFRNSNLNKSYVSPKPVNEWDSIIRNDVKRYEEEQKQHMLKEKQLKRQIMNDLNAQMQEKRRLQREQKEYEKVAQHKLDYINSEQDKRRKQQELWRSRKNEDEKRIMETQIAEAERIKRFEKDKDRAQALNEKKEVDRALEDELKREQKKKKEYQEVCQRQYQDNMLLKQHMKEQEQREKMLNNQKKKDMFGDMFEEKKHVSYDYAAKNQRKFDALNKILHEENERKNKIKNYAQFEQDSNGLEKKQMLNEQLKENKLKADYRNNRKFLEEQIKLRKDQEKFEKDFDRNAARLMNIKAQEELDKEAERNASERQKRLKNKNELRTQMDFKSDPFANMTEQERLLNRDRLELSN